MLNVRMLHRPLNIHLELGAITVQKGGQPHLVREKISISASTPAARRASISRIHLWSPRFPRAQFHRHPFGSSSFPRAQPARFIFLFNFPARVHSLYYSLWFFSLAQERVSFLIAGIYLGYRAQLGRGCII